MIDSLPVELATGFKLGPAIIVGLSLVLFVVVGITSRVGSEEGFWVADRGIGPVPNGMALASNWISVASFLGMAGMIYLHGFSSLSFVIGWTGGYAVFLVLLAAQIQRFGKYTAVDLIGDRYDSATVWVLGALVTIVIAFVYSVAQYQGIGLIIAWIFGLDYAISTLVGAAIVTGYVILSGMLGVIRNQVVQYLLLIIPFLVPLFFIANRAGYLPLVPQLGYGQALGEMAHDAGRAWYDPTFTAPFAGGSAYTFIAVAFTLMMGTLGLPHVINRFYTVRNERDARWSVVWGLLFISALYWAAPAYAVLARVLQGGAQPTAEHADLVTITAGHLAQLPAWFVGLIGAGAIAAGFSTTAGLLSSGAAAISHDLFFRVLRPSAKPRQRIQIARLTTGVLGLAIMVSALQPPALIAEVVGSAFSLAAATICPVLVLGVWWGRVTRQAATAGMVTGLALWVFTSWGDWYGHVEWVRHWAPAGASALVTLPVVIAVMVVVTLLTRAPGEEVQALLRRLHGIDA